MATQFTRWLIESGDRILVDVSCYTHVKSESPCWCTVHRISEGDAAAYPVKAIMPDGSEGQFSFQEIKDVEGKWPEH